MSGVGPVYEMIARLRFNESLKRKRKGYFTIAGEYRKVLKDKELTYGTSTQADLKEIRETVRAHHREIMRRRFFAMALIMLFLVILISALLFSKT